MPKVDVYDIKGKKVSDVELAENIFGIEPNEAIVHSVLVNFLANQRQGTQNTKTRAEFVQALKDYSDLNDDNASDVADKFRKALERFFQEFFGKNGTLENLKKEYGTYMKEKGVPAELSNNLESLLQAYTNFMNGYAKHHSKTNKNLLEYIMYQTGNMIRLLITIKGAERWMSFGHWF